MKQNCKKHKKIVAKRADEEIKNNTLDFILMIIFLSWRYLVGELRKVDD